MRKELALLGCSAFVLAAGCKVDEGYSYGHAGAGGNASGSGGAASKGGRSSGGAGGSFSVTGGAGGSTAVAGTAQQEPAAQKAAISDAANSFRICRFPLTD